MLPRYLPTLLTLHSLLLLTPHPLRYRVAFFDAGCCCHRHAAWVRIDHLCWGLCCGFVGCVLLITAEGHCHDMPGLVCGINLLLGSVAST